MGFKGTFKSARLLSRVGVLVGLSLLATFLGCNGSDFIRGNRNGVGAPVPAGDTSTPAFGILNFLSNSAFSEDVVLTVIYSVPDTAQSVVGFLQLLNAPANVGGTPIGVEEIVSTELTAGQDQTFLLDTSDLRPGFYQIGVRADDQTFLSVGTMEVQGPPSPLFLEPTFNVTVESGQFVDITADIGDPQGVANWRLFFQDADAPLLEEGQAAGGQLLGRRIAEGMGNSVDLRWDTRNVETGTYRLGLSATDVGLTIAGAVQSGQAATIVTTYSDATVTLQPPPEASRPPTIDLLTAAVTAFGGDPVEIQFSAEVFEGDAFVVTFFSVFNGVENVFATVTDPGINTVTFATADLTSGIYEIGARISDGLNDVVEVPTVGRVPINVVQAADATLTVSQPGDSLRIAQGEDVDIEWTTNVPADRGTIDVFARRFLVTEPLGDETNQITIRSGLSTSVDRVTWTTSTETGLFVIVVKLTVTDPPRPDNPVLAAAPGIVRVSLTAPQFWLGQIGAGLASTRQGELYQGVNFQDNAGTFLNALGDYDGDGRDDYVIGARYGKPFFLNPSGIGIGEAYVIFGDARQNRTHNLNTAGTSLLRGVALPGIRPRGDAQDETDGMGAIRPIPDQDGDGIPELMFGFPFVNSRGHTFSLVVRQEPLALNTLEKEGQFKRGGVVIVSSQSPSLSSPLPADQLPPDPDAPVGEKATIFLDLVGQNFRKAEVVENRRDPVGTACGGDQRDDFFFDELTLNGVGVCVDGTDTPPCFETFFGPWEGFNRELSDSYTAIRLPFSLPLFFNGVDCACAAVESFVFFPADPFLRACTLFLGQGGPVDLSTTVGFPLFAVEQPGDMTVGSGFYPLRYCSELLSVVVENEPRPPFGARIIGRDAGPVGFEATMGDKFGASIAVSGGFLLVGTPNRQPVPGELIGVPDSEIPNDPGVVYLFNLNNLWVDWRNAVEFLPDTSIVGNFQGGGPDQQGYFVAMNSETVEPAAPPMPYQYQIDEVGHCGRSNKLLERFPSPFKVVGEPGQKIEVTEGVPDFNLDQREDFVIGSPLGNSGDGVAYIAYRRDPDIEGNYLLLKLSLDPLDQERLAGLRINGRSGDQEGFGEVIARSNVVADATGAIFNQTIDFNGDGRQDIILGNPNADNGKGEIIVIFATNDLVSPVGGYDLDELLALNPLGAPRAVRIVGREAGDHFGFNVAVVRDFNGDGVNDLLVSAPGASPMFDSNDDGTLDTPGIDVVNLTDPGSAFGDGAPDSIPGAGDNLLTDAGEVYLILGPSGGSNNLATLADPVTRTVDIAKLGTNTFRGLVFVGRATADALGGGNEVKRNKRSFGIGSAGDVDGDGRGDILIGSILADPEGRTDAGEAYLIYGFGL